MCRKFGLAVILCTAVFAYIDSAPASIIFFDNPPGPGHFAWANAPGGGVRNFDPRIGPESQPPPSAVGPANMGQVIGITPSVSRLSGNGRIQITSAPPGGSGLYATSFPAGTLFPAPGFNYATGTSTIQDATVGGWIPEGVETFLSVRFNPTGANSTQCTSGVNCHYGWVKVVRTGLALDALAWAYEADNETPILTPEPASAFLLALCAPGLVACRRTRANRK